VASGSLARPRPVQRLDGEVSEVLMHPLGKAFDVGDDHADHLFNCPFLKIGEPMKKMQLSGISLVFS
jgi:hypothetical protein